MKGHGCVRAAAQTFFGRVVNVLPIPKVFGYVTGDQVMLRNKREKPAAAVRISAVSRFNVQIGQTFA